MSETLYDSIALLLWCALIFRATVGGFRWSAIVRLGAIIRRFRLRELARRLPTTDAVILFVVLVGNIVAVPIIAASLASRATVSIVIIIATLGWILLMVLLLLLTF